MVLAAGVVGALLLLMFLLPGGPAPGPGSSRGGPDGGVAAAAWQVGSDAGPAEAGSEGRQPLDAAEGGPEAAGGYGWQGVVVSEDGTPLPGVRIVAFARQAPWEDRSQAMNFSVGMIPNDWGATWEDDSPLFETTSDGHGRFFLQWPEDVAWDPESEFTLTGFHPGFICRQKPLPPPSRPPAHMRLVLTRCTARVVAEVVDQETDKPVPGIPLVLATPSWWLRGTTDAMGQVLLEAPAGETAVFTVAGGYGADLYGPGETYLRSGVTQHVQFRLLKRGPLAVRLIAVDRVSGAVLPEATFFRESERTGHTQKLHSSGGVLDWRSPSGHPEFPVFRVQAPGYLPTEVVLNDGKEPEILVGMWPAAEEEVMVRVLRSGQPEPGAQVTVGYGVPFQFGGADHWQATRASYGGLEISASGRTDSDGLVRLPMTMPAGRRPEWVNFHVLPASGDAFEALCVRTDTLGPGPWVLDLEASFTDLEFQVRDRTGTPVAGLGLRLQVAPVEGSPPLLKTEVSRLPPRFYEGHTDVTGRWSVRVLAPARFRWEIPGAHYRARRYEMVLPGKKRVVPIQVAGREAISGRVVDADGRPWHGQPVGLYLVREDGSPIEGAEGSSSSYGPSWAVTHTGLMQSTFRFECVPPGRYRIRVRRLPLIESAGTPAAAGDENVVVRIAPHCVLVLTLVDEEDRPVLADVDYTLLQRGPSWRKIHGHCHVDTSIIRFGASERVWLAIDPEGNYARKLLDLGSWAPGEDRSLVVRLQQGRHVVLHFPSDLPVGSVLPVPQGVEVADRLHEFAERVSGERWDVYDAPRDAFTLLVWDEDGRPMDLSWTVPAGQEDLELTLDPATAQRTTKGR